jgi:hypothetical protein
MAEALRLIEQRRELPAVGCAHAIKLSLDLALQNRERVAQLMGDIGQESAAVLAAGSEPRRHVVERGSEQTQLSRAAHRDFDLVVRARGDLLGGVQ